MEFRQPSTVVSTTAPTTVTTGTNYSSQKMAGIKQCRSNPDLEVDSGGPFKLLRKDSSYWSSSPGQGFLGSQAQLGSGDLKMNMSLNSDGSSFVCSPTSSCISDSAFLDCGLVGESRSSSYNQQMRPGGADLMMALNSGSHNASPGYGDSSLLRPFSYQAQPLGYGYRSTSGPTLLMGRESIQSMYGISPTTITASSGPFTSTQWAELEHQALIFKYMMAGANVPPDLLYPIRKSVAAMAGVMGHHPTSLGWGNFHLGMANNPDPEPGRCRRTDGKKWRCSREVVPDQKYCERHMHRGRNRSKKTLENNSAPAGTNSQGSPAVLGSNNADSNPIQASNPPSNQLNRPQIGSNLQQKPIHQLGSSIIGGSGQFNPIPQLQSAAAAQSTLGGTKDYRFGVAEQGGRLMGPCLNVPESKLCGYGGGLRGRYVDLEDNAGQLDGMLGKGHNFFENGPLGEALQSRKNWGLNLLCDGWDSVPTSPKGVLQKSAFASLSDTSSSASSPIL